MTEQSPETKLAIKQGERLAIVETEVKTITEKINNVENSVNGLHGKLDTMTKVLTENYVAKDTLEQYKKTQEEKEKNRLLDRLLTIIVTSVILGLIGFFFREKGF